MSTPEEIEVGRPGLDAARAFYGARMLGPDGQLTDTAKAEGWRIERSRIDATLDPSTPQWIDGRWDLVRDEPHPAEPVGVSDEPAPNFISAEQQKRLDWYAQSGVGVSDEAVATQTHISNGVTLTDGAPHAPGQWLQYPGGRVTEHRAFPHGWHPVTTCRVDACGASPADAGVIPLAAHPTPTREQIAPWLYGRFGVSMEPLNPTETAPDWADLSEDTKAWWVHEADAVLALMGGAE